MKLQGKVAVITGGNSGTHWAFLKKAVAFVNNLLFAACRKIEAVEYCSSRKTQE